MMQLLALTAMEPPSLFEPDRVRDERAKVFRSLRPFEVDNLDEHLVLGQYAAGRLLFELVPVPRLTLTETVLNLGRRVLFLVAGRGKAAIVQRVLEGGDHSLPAARIRPQHGAVTWMLDCGAASLLTDKSPPLPSAAL